MNLNARIDPVSGSMIDIVDNLPVSNAPRVTIQV